MCVCVMLVTVHVQCIEMTSKAATNKLVTLYEFPLDLEVSHSYELPTNKHVFICMDRYMNCINFCLLYEQLGVLQTCLFFFIYDFAFLYVSFIRKNKSK